MEETTLSNDDEYYKADLRLRDELQRAGIKGVYCSFRLLRKKDSAPLAWDKALMSAWMFYGLNQNTDDLSYESSTGTVYVKRLRPELKQYILTDEQYSALEAAGPTR